jgi:hypothetical protein
MLSIGRIPPCLQSLRIALRATFCPRPFEYHRQWHGSYDALYGDGSVGQANLNLGIGLAGLTSGFFVPGAIYFISSNSYPGGPAAYNAAYSQAINDFDGGP